MRYRIWRVRPLATPAVWIVVRPGMTVVRYCRTFEQARRAYIGDLAARHQAVPA